MALTIKKKVQNYIIDQGTTFEKTIGAESSASVAVTISSGTVAGGMVKNHSYAPILRLEDSIGGEILLQPQKPNFLRLSSSRRSCLDLSYNFELFS